MPVNKICKYASNSTCAASQAICTTVNENICISSETYTIENGKLCHTRFQDPNCSTPVLSGKTCMSPDICTELQPGSFVTYQYTPFDNKGSDNTGVVYGLIGVLVLLLIGGYAYFSWRKRVRDREAASQNTQQNANVIGRRQSEESNNNTKNEVAPADTVVHMDKIAIPSLDCRSEQSTNNESPLTPATNRDDRVFQELAPPNTK